MTDRRERMSETRVYRGWIAEHSHGEGEDILFLTGVEDPLAEEIKYDISRYGSYLSVCYFTAEREATLAELEDSLIRTLDGDGEAVFHQAYSDITGYLWTDEELRVGGHNLLDELRDHIGQFCHLEITYSENQPE